MPLPLGIRKGKICSLSWWCIGDNWSCARRWVAGGFWREVAAHIAAGIAAEGRSFAGLRCKMHLLTKPTHAGPRTLNHCGVVSQSKTYATTRTYA